MVTMKSHLVVSICFVFQVARPGIPVLAANIPGLKNVGKPHIVGGNEAQPNSHPYIVGVDIVNTTDNHFWFCGGSLLSETWVVTARHCTFFTEHSELEARIIAGAHRIREPEKWAQIAWIEKIYKHPGFEEVTMKDDIALIRLTSPLKLDNYVQPIRLPSQKQKNWWFFNQKVTQIGWGATVDGNLAMAPTLREVETRTIPNFLCKLAYLFYYVYDSNMCASGWYSKGFCYGDSGGPMTMLESDGKRTLIGISSFGHTTGCEKNYPTVLSRTTSFLDWIYSTTDIPIRL